MVALTVFIRVPTGKGKHKRDARMAFLRGTGKNTLCLPTNYGPITVTLWVRIDLRNLVLVDSLIIALRTNNLLAMLAVGCAMSYCTMNNG